jgi:hypothetical protein
MHFNDRNRECHAERSEESRCSARQILRCAQHDTAGLNGKSASSMEQYVLDATMVEVKNTDRNERIVSGIFVNEENNQK